MYKLSVLADSALYPGTYSTCIVCTCETHHHKKTLWMAHFTGHYQGHRQSQVVLGIRLSANICPQSLRLLQHDRAPETRKIQWNNVVSSGTLGKRLGECSRQSGTYQEYALMNLWAGDKKEITSQTLYSAGIRYTFSVSTVSRTPQGHYKHTLWSSTGSTDPRTVSEALVREICFLKYWLACWKDSLDLWCKLWRCLSLHRSAYKT